MSQPIQCFMIEETERQWHSFMRFEAGRCSKYGEYHHAMAYEDDVESSLPPRIPVQGDPRLPTHCECGHEFAPNTISTSAGKWYRDPRNGNSFRQLAQAPHGAMVYAPYLLNDKAQLSPEYVQDHMGKRDPIIVMLPDGGFWCVDQKARWNGTLHGTGWRTTGEAPAITANPSIRTTRYHGFLRNGVLEPCADSQC